jgi:glycosyltransferase involved in cell wall biosynthesis
MIHDGATQKKLLIVTDDANMGGTYRVAEQLAAGAAASFDLRFACSFETKNAESRERIERSGVALFDYRASERNPQRAAFAFEDAQRLLDAAEPDVILLVEGGEIWSLLAVKQVAAARGIPYVVSINLLTDDCMRRFPELRAKAIETLRAAQAIVFVSQASRRRFEALLPRIDTPMHVVANSRPARYFEIGGVEARRAARASLGLREDETLFLCAARIEPRKGQTLCLEALERLRAQGRLSGLRLVLAGGGASGDVEALQRAIEEKRLGAHVLTLGARDDVPSLLDACDAFVLPSYSEGMPLSIIEAMAKGRAVIATAVDGVPEQIDRLSGILLPAPSLARDDCVVALADAMAALRDDPRTLDQLGRCARLRALELFDETRMIGDYRAIVARAAFRARPERFFTALRAHPLLREAASSRERQALRGRAPLLPRLAQWTDASAWREFARMRAVRRDLRKGLAPGSQIELRDPAQCWSWAHDGWDVAEDVGVWNDGAVSIIRLRLRRPMRRLRIQFDLTPFSPAGRRQETDVFCAGALVAGWRFDAQVWERRRIDICRRKSGRTLELRFVHKTRFSPRAAGLSDDARELAMFLHRIEILRIPLRERLRELFRLDALGVTPRHDPQRAPAE